MSLSTSENCWQICCLCHYERWSVISINILWMLVRKRLANALDIGLTLLSTSLMEKTISSWQLISSQQHAILVLNKLRGRDLLGLAISGPNMRFGRQRIEKAFWIKCYNWKQPKHITTIGKKKKHITTNNWQVVVDNNSTVQWRREGRAPVGVRHAALHLDL